jgi:hypothetical protein
MKNSRRDVCLKACEGMENPEHAIRGLRADAEYLKKYREAYCALVTRDNELRIAAKQAVESGDVHVLANVLKAQTVPLIEPVRPS